MIRSSRLSSSTWLSPGQPRLPEMGKRGGRREERRERTNDKGRGGKGRIRDRRREEERRGERREGKGRRWEERGEEDRTGQEKRICSPLLQLQGSERAVPGKYESRPLQVGLCLFDLDWN